LFQLDENDSVEEVLYVIGTNMFCAPPPTIWCGNSLYFYQARQQAVDIIAEHRRVLTPESGKNELDD